MQVQYLHCINAGEMLISRKPANRKGWGWSSNILPQVCNNKMAASNANSLPISTGYMPCSTVVGSMLFYAMAYGPKLQTLQSFSKTIS